MKKSKLSLWACIAAGLCLAQPARADVQYVTETRLPGQSSVKPLSTVTAFRKAGAERVETLSRLGAFEQRSITIKLCDQHQTFTLNPSLKMYFEVPMVKVETENATDRKADADAGETGTITMTLVSLRPLEDQKIGEVTAKCYEVVTRMQSAGCAGVGDFTSKQEICVAENESLGESGCEDYEAALGNGGADENNCKISVVRKGDWTLYNKIKGQLQVRARAISEGGPPSVETQSKIVSRAKLSDDLFTVPADFQKVTVKEFQKAQSAALMKELIKESAR